MNNEQGVAFVTVIAFIFVSLAAVMILQKKVSTLVNVYKNELYIQSQQDGKFAALAQAVGLLQTGEPPHNESSYSLVLNEREGQPKYEVVFTKTGGKKWSVKVSPTAKNLPALPDTF